MDIIISFCEEKQFSMLSQHEFAQKRVEAGGVSHVPCLFCLFFFGLDAH